MGKKGKTCCKFCLHHSLANFQQYGLKTYFFYVLQLKKFTYSSQQTCPNTFIDIRIYVRAFLFILIITIDFFEDFWELKTMGNPKGTCMFIAKGMKERGLTKLNTIISIYFKACSMIQLNL